MAVCSTGLIGVRLPMDKITATIPTLVDGLAADGGSAAATAIMTTDTVVKEAVVRARRLVGRRDGQGCSDVGTRAWPPCWW